MKTETIYEWYFNSISKLQTQLNVITQDSRRHQLHNEGGWDHDLVRLDVCKDIVNGLAAKNPKANLWREEIG